MFHPLKIATIEDQTSAAPLDPVPETPPPLVHCDVANLTLNSQFQEMEIAEFMPSEFLFEEGEEEEIARAQVRGVGWVWQTPPFQSVKGFHNSGSSMRRHIIHMQKVLVMHAPVEVAPPDSEMVPHILQEDLEESLINGLILVEFHMQDAFPVKERDHH